MYKKLLTLALVVSIGFSASTNWQNTRVAEKATRTIPLALGAAVTNTITGTSSTTLNIAATYGRGELAQWNKLNSDEVAVSTIDVVVVSELAVGDVFILQSTKSTNDMVVVDDALTIFLGAAFRTLDEPQDILGLMVISSNAVAEVFFIDNN